jgi:medium-chain acyl-[acyl-carrier-protein] hydrolase
MGSATSWITSLKAGSPGSPRLICFPYAGGGSAVFRNWPSLLHEATRLCAIRLPGRETRVKEAPFRSLEPLVKELANVLSGVIDGPYVFFGHSMGALIAFAVSREFRRQRVPLPDMLIAAGARAPHLPLPRPPKHDLPDPLFIDELRRLEGTPKEALEHPELMELMLPLLRADFALVETYRFEAEAPLACPIVAFGGQDDHEVPIADVEAWRLHTTSTFSYRVFPGGHFFLQESEVEVVAEVEKYLARGPQGASATAHGRSKWGPSSVGGSSERSTGR